MLFLIVFVGPLSAQQATSEKCITKVGEPSEPSPGPLGCSQTSGGGGPCQEAPVVDYTANQYVDAIKEKWGFTIVGLSQDQLEMFWQEFHEIDCVGLLQDIKGSEIEGWSNDFSQQFSCPGDDRGVDLRFGNHHGEFVKALIAHELTHIWQFCSEKGEANRLEIPPVYAKEGGLTNYSRSGCGFGVDLQNEDHADTIALYLNPWSGELTCGNGAPNPFAGGGFPLHRSVAENGVGKQ